MMKIYLGWATAAISLAHSGNGDVQIGGVYRVENVTGNMAISV